jgi:hypothetical protein
MEQQTGILAESVEASKTSAAANGQIKLVKAKERAQLHIDLARLGFQRTSYLSPYTVKFELSLVGITAADVLEESCYCVIQESTEVPKAPTRSGRMGIPRLIRPRADPITGSIVIHWYDFVDATGTVLLGEEVMQRVREGTPYIFVGGFIRYEDVFNDRWMRNFLAVWEKPKLIDDGSHTGWRFLFNKEIGETYRQQHAKDHS